ncbi:MAG TPA: cation:proton antiporter [Gemmatimonadaceae bacterium]|nr:cation:proton antiporter [Gemmatimonadaceae bacterium]
MNEATDFLRNLALVLCVAAVTTVLFQRLRQPVIFGYLMAGLIIGPHIPLPLAVDESMVHTLSGLGVILLMFGLGLEFSLRKLIQVGPTAGLVAVAENSMMIWFGYLLGQLLGWGTLESVFAGAVIAISSTTIIVKAFDEQGVGGKVAETVFGVLIIEDMVGIFLIAILTTLGSGAGVSAGSIALLALRLVTFLIGLVGGGLLFIPRLVRYVVRLDRPETTLVASIGICFAAALLALAFGYSVALGAFVAGSLVSESGEEKAIAHLIAPVRDMFVAIFFVAVGMMIDPHAIAEHWVAVLAFAAVVITGKVVAVSLSAFLTGFPLRTSVQTGMSLAQIGEFSFIIAGVGIATGATRSFLYPVAIAVSAITTLTTPWLIKASGPAANFVDRRLPHALQTFVALYGSWVERLRSAPRESGGVSRTRYLIRVLLLDAVLLTVWVIGASLQFDAAAGLLADLTHTSVETDRLIVFIVAVLVSAPLAVGVFRSSRQLAQTLALRALPGVHEGGLDLAHAPRIALFVTLHLAILLLVGAPVVAITQPFLPPLRGALLLAFVAVVLLIGIYRSATRLQDHAQAGAAIIVSALAKQMAAEPVATGGDGSGEETLSPEMRDDQMVIESVHHMLPGLGDPVSVRLWAHSPGVHRTLAELNLRGLTGATVLAITRQGEPVMIPTGHEVLRDGDVLAIAGSHEAIAAAVEMLRSERPPGKSP